MYYESRQRVYRQQCASYSLRCIRLEVVYVTRYTRHPGLVTSFDPCCGVMGGSSCAGATGDTLARARCLSLVSTCSLVPLVYQTTYLPTCLPVPSILPTCVFTYIHLLSYLPISTYFPTYLYLLTYLPVYLPISTYFPTYLYLLTYLPVYLTQHVCS